MTIGTLILTILGILYLVWSYYAVKEIKYEGFNGVWDEITSMWFAIHILLILLGIVFIIISFWNYKLF